MPCFFNLKNIYKSCANFSTLCGNQHNCSNKLRKLLNLFFLSEKIAIEGRRRDRHLHKALLEKPKRINQDVTNLGLTMSKLPQRRDGTLNSSFQGSD